MQIKKLIKAALEEDIGSGDITTECLVGVDECAKAYIETSEECVLAGLPVAKMAFYEIDPTLKLEININEGELCLPGKIIEIEGRASSILVAERTALNLLMRMSGIATTTNKLVRTVRCVDSNIRVAATRKTAPGLRYFDKRAVVIGGGDPHRLKLDDAFLIKDNHIKVAGGIEKAIKKVYSSASLFKKVEIEAKTKKEALKAAELGVDIVMLDNMDPNQVNDAINLLKRNNLREKVIIEVSGGINKDNIVDYLKSVDIISTSELTLFPSEKVDLSLEFD